MPCRKLVIGMKASPWFFSVCCTWEFGVGSYSLFKFCPSYSLMCAGNIFVCIGPLWEPLARYLISS